MVLRKVRQVTPELGPSLSRESRDKAGVGCGDGDGGVLMDRNSLVPLAGQLHDQHFPGKATSGSCWDFGKAVGRNSLN